MSLAPRAFEPLPLGAIAPHGWLLDQLVRQASSLSGYLSSTQGVGSWFHGDSNVVNMTQWLGGPGWAQDHLDESDTWFPYWADGNVPLLKLLNASDALGKLPDDLPLGALVDSYVNYILANDVQSDGFIGHGGIWAPDSALGEGGFQIVQALTQWAEGRSASDRRRVAKAVTAHLVREASLIVPASPSIVPESWVFPRWPTFVRLVEYCVDSLLPEFGDDASVVPLGRQKTTEVLVGAAHRFASLGMDWRRYYNGTAPSPRTGGKLFPAGAVPDWNLFDHGVNNAEGALRWPATLYRLNGSRADGLAAMRLVLGRLDEHQGQIQSLLCADEVLCGRPRTFDGLP